MQKTYSKSNFEQKHDKSSILPKNTINLVFCKNMINLAFCKEYCNLLFAYLYFFNKIWKLAYVYVCLKESLFYISTCLFVEYGGWDDG